MAIAPSVYVVLEDSTGRKSTLRVHTQASNGVDEFRGLARALAQTADNISDCRIVEYGANIPFPPSVFSDLTLKNTANESDVENKAYFSFEDEDGIETSITVPGLRDNLVDDETNLLDTSAGAVSAFITAMTSNFADNALNIVPVNSREKRLLRVTAAFQQFRRSRTTRSASKLDA